jgi:hypothetical protein
MPASLDIEIAIWERLIHPRGGMTREAARRILQLDLSEEQRRRMSELAAANRAGKLSAEEEAELDGHCRAANMLTALKSRARQVLKSRRTAS